MIAELSYAVLLNLRALALLVYGPGLSRAQGDFITTQLGLGENEKCTNFHGNKIEEMRKSWFESK